MANSVIQDEEFGAISIRRSRLAKRVALKIDQRGVVTVSMPLRTPLFWAKTLLSQSREQIRQHLAKAQNERAVLRDGDLIGKTHRLVVSGGDDFNSRLIGTELHVMLPLQETVESPSAQHFIKQAALKALRTQAKAYLGRRLEALAVQYNFFYNSIRFSNAGTRWGSCSSSGTISLNIWLMQLPFELIDYVLLHELSHTRHMNHSPQFWATLEAMLPDYRERRKLLKQQRPYL